MIRLFCSLKITRIVVMPVMLPLTEFKPWEITYRDFNENANASGHISDPIRVDVCLLVVVN